MDIFWGITSGFFPVFSAVWFEPWVHVSVSLRMRLFGRFKMPVQLHFFGSVQGRFYWWMHSRCLPSWFTRPLMRCIMAGLDQQEQFMAPCTKLRKFRSYSSSWSSSFLSLRRGRSPWSFCDHEIPLLLDIVVDIPVVQGRAASGIWSRRAEYCGSTVAVPCLVVHIPVAVHDKFCWCRSCRSSLVVDSLSFEVADVPVVWPCRSSVAAVVVSAAVPQLQPVVLVLGQSRSHARCVATTFVWWFRVAENCDGPAVAVL